MTNKTKLKLLSDQTEAAMWRSVSKKGGGSSPDVPTWEGAEYFDAYTGKILKSQKNPQTGEMEKLTLSELAGILQDNEKKYDSIREKIDGIRRQIDEDHYNDQKAKGIDKPVINPAAFDVGFRKLTPQEQADYLSSDVMVWGIKRFLKHAVNMHPRESVNTDSVAKNIEQRLREFGFTDDKHSNIIRNQGHKRVLMGVFGKAGAGNNVMDNVSWDNTVAFYDDEMVREHDDIRTELYNKLARQEISEKELEDTLSQTRLSRTREILFKKICHRKLTTERSGLQLGDVSAFRTGVHRRQIDLGTGAINLPHEHFIFSTRVINDSNYANLKSISQEDIKRGNIQKEAKYTDIRRVTASTSINDEKFNSEFVKYINEALIAANLPVVEFVKKHEKLDRFANVIPSQVQQTPINTQAATELTQNIQPPVQDKELTKEEKEAIDEAAKQAIDENTVKNITDVSIDDADPILVKAHAILKEKSERLAKELLDTKETADAVQAGIIASVNLKKANNQIESLTKDVAEKEKSLTEANNTLVVKDEIIQEKENEVNAFAAKNNELFDKLTASDTELAQRDFETKQIVKVFKNPKLISEIKDNNLVSNDDMYSILTGIESKQAGIKRLRNKINKIYKDKRVEVNALNEQVEKLEGKVNSLSRVIKAKNMVVAKKDNIISSLNNTVVELKDNITTLIDSHAKKLTQVKSTMKAGYRSFIEKLKDNFNNKVIPAKEAEAKSVAIKSYEKDTLPVKIKDSITAQTPVIEAKAINNYEKDILPVKVVEAITSYKNTEEYKEEFTSEVSKSVSERTKKLSDKITELEKSSDISVETLALYVIELREQIESLNQSPMENKDVDNILSDLQKSLGDDNENTEDNNNAPKR